MIPSRTFKEPLGFLEEKRRIYEYMNPYMNIMVFESVPYFVFLFTGFSLWYWGLNSRPCTCYASPLPFEPCLHPFFHIINVVFSYNK
jgi:hypothetical protein